MDLRDLGQRPVTVRAVGDPSSSARRRATFLRLLPGLVALAFVIVQGALASTSTLDPDSARYAQLAFQYQGDDEPTAHLRAEQVWCVDQARATVHKNATQVLHDPTITYPVVYQGCLAANADHFTPTASPRYQSIFATRPGYPLAVAALGTVTGIRFALWAVPVVSVLLAGLGIWRLLGLLGIGPRLAATGQALTYLLPTGTWGVHALTEGPILAGVVAALLGGTLLLHERPRSGTALLALGLAWTSLVKYTTGLPLAILLLVAALAAWLLLGSRRRDSLVLGGICALTVATLLAVSWALSLPDLRLSAQDLFTHHFAHPDVPNVWQHLIDANVHYWLNWPELLSAPNLANWNILLLVGIVVGARAVWRVDRPVAALVLAATAVGIVLTTAHPDPTGGDRLYVLCWLAVVIGVPVAGAHVTRDADKATT